MYNAINLGFERASGDILGWLNSDDFYFPGTLDYVAANLEPANPELLFGNAFHFVQGRADNWGSDVIRASQTMQLMRFDYIIQPSAFWTRAAWNLTGRLDAHFIMQGIGSGSSDVSAPAWRSSQPRAIFRRTASIRRTRRAPGEKGAGRS
jgi:hypothetical protein